LCIAESREINGEPEAVAGCHRESAIAIESDRSITELSGIPKLLLHAMKMIILLKE
jgi:hypothetical protein